MSLSAALRRQVWTRAGQRCEYCQMLQDRDPASFEVDHIVPEKMGGPTSAENLALACFKCNNHNGPNIAGIDPDTNQKTYLYDPRHDQWNENFRWEGPRLVGLTAVGRATVALLRINDGHRLAHRRQLAVEGVFPPAY